MKDMQMSYSIRFENVRIVKNEVSVTPLILLNNRVVQTLDTITVRDGDGITISDVFTHTIPGVFVREILATF